MSDMKGRILVYSIVGCPFCIRAKVRLEDLGLTFIDINLDSNPTARQKMVELTGKKTVPQIFFNAIYVGGFTELNKLCKEEVDRLIEEVMNNEPPEDAPIPPNEIETAEDARDILDFTCQLDEYAALKKQLQESGIVKDHRKGLRVYKNSFLGKEAVNWLIKNKNLEHEQAMEMCNHLVEKHFGHAVQNKNKEVEFRDDETIYRFLEDDKSNALNAGISSDCEPRAAAEVGKELRKLILSIYNDNLSRNGKKVDYKAIGESTNFELYIKHTAELQRVQLEDATRQEKLAFFINIYNALVIHAFVTIGAPMNLWQRYKFFNVTCYIIGGYVYSLQDIENGILRANRKALGAIKKPFSKADPRLAVALSEPEPKIHFALVCGAKSCPAINTYSAEDVDSQLKLSTESFLEGDGCFIDVPNKMVKLSQILKWYKEDFGSHKDEVCRWVHNNMGNCLKKTQLAELLTSGDYKLKYLPYDWSVNS